MSTDTLLEGVHFPERASGDIVAQRTFAACLSDLAAMGAVPHSLTGALTMPGVDEAWLGDFSETLDRLSKEFRIPLVGGNLTRGNLSVTLTVIGTCPTGQAALRSGARADDLVFVTGFPGHAGAGLRLLADGKHGTLVDAYCFPVPRIKAGQLLRTIATAMIDVSDGLLGDLNHIMQASGVGATIDSECLPISNELLETYSRDTAISLVLTAGDDYELLFTIPADKSEAVASLSRQIGLPIRCIGKVCEGEAVLVDGEQYAGSGYQHF